MEEIILNKVGIITSSYASNGTFGCNYGAALQGYALVKQLRLMNYDAYDINYNSRYVHNPQQYSFIKGIASRFKLLFNPRIVKNKLISLRNRRNWNTLSSSFRRFIAENELTFDDGAFYTFDELKILSRDFYAFITGSDVVWNPNLHKGHNDEGFFLDFAADGVKRIAYAPSTGITSFPDTAKGDLGDFLRKFDALSIREQSGADLIRNLTGIDLDVVLDPTLLLPPEEYDEIIRLPDDIPPEYILVYKFGEIPHTQEQIDKLQKELDLPVICIPAGKYGKRFSPRYDVGPGGFVGLIRNARIVMTDSFHCSVFCLIYHTPFYTFFRTMPKPGQDINSRMSNLLRMVHLDNRMIAPGDEIDFSNMNEIDFESADRIIDSMRKESCLFLKNALEA